MSIILNGHGNPVEQEIVCGAAVPLSQAVLDHGIVLLHPELPPIRLHLALASEDKDISKNGISRYVFEKIEPKHGPRTKYAIVIVEEEPESTLQIPEKPKLLV